MQVRRWVDYALAHPPAWGLFPSWTGLSAPWLPYQSLTCDRFPPRKGLGTPPIQSHHGLTLETTLCRARLTDRQQYITSLTHCSTIPGTNGGSEGAKSMIRLPWLPLAGVVSIGMQTEDRRLLHSRWAANLHSDRKKWTLCHYNDTRSYLTHPHSTRLNSPLHFKACLPNFIFLPQGVHVSGLTTLFWNRLCFLSNLPADAHLLSVGELKPTSVMTMNGATQRDGSLCCVHCLTLGQSMTTEMSFQSPS